MWEASKHFEVHALNHTPTVTSVQILCNTVSRKCLKMNYSSGLWRSHLKYRKAKGTANVISTDSKIVIRHRRWQYKTFIIKRTINIVLGPSPTCSTYLSRSPRSSTKPIPPPWRLGLYDENRSSVSPCASYNATEMGRFLEITVKRLGTLKNPTKCVCRRSPTVGPTSSSVRLHKWNQP